MGCVVCGVECSGVCGLRSGVGCVVCGVGCVKWGFWCVERP